MISRTTGLIAAGYLVALSWGFYEWSHPTPEVPAASAAKPGAIPLPLASLERPFIGDIDAFDELVERPLFSPERVPEGANAETSNEQGEPAIDRSQELAAMRLSAIIVDGDEPIALIENVDGSFDKVRAGEKFRGWEVAAIRDDHVVLVSGEQRHMLVLFRFDAAPVIRNAPVSQHSGQDQPPQPIPGRETPTVRIRADRRSSSAENAQ